ncbi:hypothetical protein ACE6H2_025056 [Prunus campanulata]
MTTLYRQNFAQEPIDLDSPHIRGRIRFRRHYRIRTVIAHILYEDSHNIRFMRGFQNFLHPKSSDKNPYGFFNRDEEDEEEETKKTV